MLDVLQHYFSNTVFKPVFLSVCWAYGKDGGDSGKQIYEEKP